MSLESQPKRPLDEVMMAMDVVDTLRHRQILVDRELNSDQREQNLIKRLRELYASQGIEVTDRILAEGVKALEEDRFSYKAAGGGLKHTLAKAYVMRAKWGKWLGLTLLGLLFVYGGYYLMVEAPQNRQLKQQITELQQVLGTRSEQLEALSKRTGLLDSRLESVVAEVPDELVVARGLFYRHARQALDQSRVLLSSAKDSAVTAQLDRDRYVEQSDMIAQRLDGQELLINDLDATLDDALVDIESISALIELPDTLHAALDSIRQSAKEEEAKTLASQYYTDAMASLTAGDIAAAKLSYEMLEALREQLGASYRLRIFSDGDEYSGIWRVPDQNPDAKNYYLIVEAIGSNDQALSLPILNEEDGKVYRVKKWGLRVSQALFKKVGADKQDDGIIQMRELGHKARGYLEPELSIQTTGATIISW